MAILDNLEAHWKLNEASGTRVDSHGSNDLTDINTVLQAAGKIGNAAQFQDSNSERLFVADNASLSMGDIDFSFAAWVYLDSKPAEQMYVFSKGLVSANAEYQLYWNDAADRFTFRVSDDTTSQGENADNLGAPSTATWYFIMCWHDATANTINIKVNDGTVDSAAYSLGSYDSIRPFTIGARSDGSSHNRFWDGRIDSLSVWKRVLTAQEQTDLYNGGAGLDYPFGATLEQEGFRFRNDDGSESAASWLAAQDVNITRGKNANTRLRVLANTPGFNPATQQATLQYRKVGDADSEWRDVA